MFDSITNLRDLGGLPAADGKSFRAGTLFRSGHLASSSDADVARLAGFGLKAVVDFRTADDRVAEGEDRLPAGVERVDIPMGDEAGRTIDVREIMMSRDADLILDTFGNGKSEEIALKGAANMVTRDETRAKFGQFFDQVADAGNRPLLWHCSAGKDRAGLAATIVMLAVGTPRDTIIAEYLASNDHRPPFPGGADSPYPEEIRNAIAPFVIQRPEEIEAQLAAIDAGWPNVDDFIINGLGASADQLERVRSELVE